ncbi:MAG TPA: hypothetical protein VH231_15680 [Solirubrobacteraceae bacterium]|nr:hypothetical protein [Solirubrobacteraceae bacterium]
MASQAVQQALANQRQQQEDAAQKAKLRKLQRKLAHEKGQDAQKAASAAAGGSGGSGGSGSQQGGGGAAGNGGGGPHDCGSGVTANNGGTTCSFALNVAEQYRASGGASAIQVYSPVTKQTYTMSCVGASTTTCTGGNNASVTFS